MNRHPRIASIVIGTVSGLVFLVGCGDADNPPPAETSSPATQASTTTPTTTPNVTQPAGRVIEISFRDGGAHGPSQVEVDVGETVTLRVVSDVVEEVHVHTYDLRGALDPGVPEEITFTADVPGRHEIELEGSGRRLLTLVVR